MVGIETPMDEAAESTFTQTLSVLLKSILADSDIDLNYVTTIGDSQHMGTILDVNVKFSGLYRPVVEQNLGGIIIEAFNTDTQNAFVSALNNQGDYFSGASSVILTLKQSGSRPAPTPAPTGGVQIESLPSNVPPSSSVEPPPPTDFSTSQLPPISTEQPSAISPPRAEPGSPDTLGPFYLAVLVHNTPYQTMYMDDADFDKFAEVLVAIVNEQMADSMTVVKEVTLGYQQLISLGNGLTATEVNISYEVSASTSLSASEVGGKVARAVGRNRKEILSVLQSNSDFHPYFQEIDEIQSQNIASVGDPTSTASLPDVIPERPITSPPSPSPTPPEVEEDEPEYPVVEEDSDAQEVETEEYAGPLVSDLLANDAAKAQAEKDAAKANAGVKEATAEINEPSGPGAGGEYLLNTAHELCNLICSLLTFTLTCCFPVN